MKLKPGVRILGIRPELSLGLAILNSHFPARAEMVITSVVDGSHSRASLHYAGQAADIRTRNLTPSEIEDFAQKGRNALGDSFDLVVEPTHIHLEYQPKIPL